MTLRFCLWLCIFLSFEICHARFETECRRWNTYASSRDDGLRLQSLLELAAYYHAVNKNEKSDSTALIALRLIKETDLHSQIMLGFDYFFQHISDIDVPAISNEADDMLNRAIACNEDECLAKAKSVSARIFESSGNYIKALDEAREAYIAASQCSDLHLQVSTQLTLGNLLDVNNRKLEAYRNYRQAMHKSDSVEDYSLQLNCYEHLSSYFYNLKEYRKSNEWLARQMFLIKRHPMFDLSDEMGVKIDQARNAIYLGNSIEADALLKDVINYSYHIKENSLRSDAFRLYRVMYLDMGEPGKLAALYRTTYPQEYKRIQTEQPALYMKLKAYFAVDEHNFPAARRYFDSASLFPSGNSYERSNFFTRYGQFLLLDGDTAAGILKFRLAYEWAEKANTFLPFMIKAAGQLDTLFLKRHEIDSAYYYKGLYGQLMTRWTEITSAEKILKLDLDADVRRHRLEQERQRHFRESQHNLQNIVILLCFLGGLILLIVVNVIHLSRTWLRAISFFTFMFLFECINMFIHHKMETHAGALEDSPLLVLFIKMCIAAIILVLHHNVEEKALHFFSNHRLFDITRFRFKRTPVTPAHPHHPHHPIAALPPNPPEPPALN